MTQVLLTHRKVAQPPASWSFARYLVGKMAILAAHLLITIRTSQLTANSSPFPRDPITERQRMIGVYNHLRNA